MMPDLITTAVKIVAGVIGVFASAPLVYAAFKIAFAAGGLKTSVDKIEAAMEKWEKSLDRVSEILSRHDHDITEIKAERAAEEKIKAGRRKSDIAIVTHASQG